MSSGASSARDALIALRRLQARLDAAERARHEPIAVIGMGCRYPGASGVEAFWRLLRTGGDAVGETPRGRWDADALFSADASVAGTIVSRRGGFVERLDEIDAAFFGISPREAPHVDPRQRLMLEIAWEALEDAGIPPDSLAGTRAGVFVATLTNDYDHLLFADLGRADAFSGAGTANSVVANRLSYVLDLRGPSVSLDTACSGSLVALHLACESLRAGESTLALAGGVSVNLMAKSNVFFSRAGALSPTGTCRTFDASADGMVRSDGAGLVVLKTLTRAVADGDAVIAVIAGSAVNHDGRSNGIMAPNGEAQQQVIAEAHRRAGLTAGEIQYVEAHGTGTRLGDPIEVQALGAVLGARPDRRTVLGSVKTNIGHTEAAAGIAGVIKVALAIRHRELPPTVHFREPNPLLGLDRLPFEVRTVPAPWPDPGQPLVAGISAFGFGGTNAHVVMREAPPEPRRAAAAEPPYILPLSARTPEALATIVADARQRLEAGVDPGDICRTAAVHRTHHPERVAVVADSAAALADQLAHLPAARAARRPVVAFVFSGQGSHWAGMASDLAAREPVFRDALQACHDAIARVAGVAILDELGRDAAASRLHDTALAQPAIFAVQVALAALWRSWGVSPAWVVGHSLGEVAAAHVAGALSLDAAAGVVCHRSRLMARVAGCGATAVVGLSIADTQRLIAELRIAVDVAGTNGAATTVVAGAPEAIAAVVGAAAQRGVFGRTLAGIDIAFHSSQMDPLRGELEQCLADLRPAAGDVAMVSTVTAARIDGTALDAAYWGRNLREPFRFAEAMTRLVASDCTTFIEVAPHAVLGSAINQHLRQLGVDGRVLPSMRRDQPALPVLLGSLAGLYEAGARVDWAAFHRPRGGSRTTLTHYPWQRQRHWFDQLPGSGAQTPGRETVGAGAHPLLGPRVDPAGDGPATHLWEIDANATHPLIADHRVAGAVVWPAAAFLEMTTAAARDLWPAGAIEVVDAAFEHALTFGAQPMQLQLMLTEHESGAAVALFARTPGGTWRRYARCIARVVDRVPGPLTVDLEELRTSCATAVDVDAHYAALADTGLEYGARFRVIDWLRRGDAAAMARIPGRHADRRCTLAPAVLDGAFQAVAAALGPAGERYLPIGVGRYQVAGQPPDELWCHARVTGTRGEPRLEADITLADSDGRVLGRVERLVLHHARDARPAPGSLLAEAWQALPVADDRLDADAAWVVLADRSGVGERVGRHLQDAGAQVCQVTVGPRYQQCSPTRFQVRAGERSDLEWVLAAMPAGRVGVVHAWALDSRMPSAGSPAEATLDLAVSVLHVAQALAARGGVTALHVVTCGALAAPATEIELQQAAIPGLALAIAEEYPELGCRVVDVDRREVDDIARAVIAELSAAGEEPRVAWRGGERFVARLEPVTDAAPVTGEATLREQATYLITGGLGALGLATAGAFVAAGARHLLLVSRRGSLALDAGSRARVDALAAIGARVDIAAVDLAAADAVARLEDALRGRPPLAGVVHAAGVLDDGPLAQQSAARFDRVFQPKVRGAWALHELTRRMPLDFFIGYSSAASLIGSAGQANYAAANAFLDALAAYRRAHGLPGLSICWGAWESDGMAAREVVASRLAARAVSMIAIVDGLAVLMRALGNPPLARFGMLPVDWSAFAARRVAPLPRLFDRLVPPTMTDRSGSWRAAFDAVNASERRTHVEGLVCGELAAVLGFAAGGLVDRRAGFFDLGMDSLTAVEFRNRLQARTGLPLAATLAFDHGDAEAVTTHLLTLLATAGGRAPADDVETLSDEELAAELARELDRDLV